MKKSKFTEEQIVFALKEHQQGTKVDVITKKLGICAATLPLVGAVWLIERHGSQRIKTA